MIFFCKTALNVPEYRCNINSEYFLCYDEAHITIVHGFATWLAGMAEWYGWLAFWLAG